MSDVLIVCPVHHEQDNVERLVRELDELVHSAHRVTFVYDSDDDPTLPVVTRMAAEGRPHLGLLKSAGTGPAAAIATGLRSARAASAAVVVMADLSDDLSIFDEMVAEWRRGAGIVVASRYMPGGFHAGSSSLKARLSRLLGVWLYRLGALPVRDATNNYRLYDGTFVRALPIESAGFEIAFEITAKAVRRGLKVAELPCSYRERQAGTSKFRPLKWIPGYARWCAYSFMSLLWRST